MNSLSDNEYRQLKETKNESLSLFSIDRICMYVWIDFYMNDKQTIECLIHLVP